MKSFLHMISLVILFVAAPAKVSAIDTSFNEPGFYLNTDTYEEPNGEMVILVHLDTTRGVLDNLSVWYVPEWLQDESGEWYQSTDRGDMHMHFFGFLTPPTEEMEQISQSLSINKLDGFKVFEGVNWAVHDDIDGLHSLANGQFAGTFKLRQNGEVKTEYNEHQFDTMPTGFSVDVTAPIVWTSGSVPSNLASVSIPEPASLALLSLGLTSAFRRICSK